MTLVGAGELGSAFVDFAARGGTTGFSVYGHDMLLAHNLARHRGTEHQIRFGKADVAALLAAERTQGIKVTPHSKDFLRADLAKVAEELGKA